VKPAAVSALEGSDWSENETAIGAPSSPEPPVRVASGATFSIDTDAVAVPEPPAASVTVTVRR